jgi:hypothetical protein
MSIREWLKMKNSNLITIVIAIILAVYITPDIGAAYSGGSGTALAPYQIANTSDFLQLAGDTGNYGKYFILTADINLDPLLPGGKVFTTAAIAPYGYNFTGHFDGNDHAISNLTITGAAGSNNLGLFGFIRNSEIKNLRLENINVNGGDNVQFIGSLVGFCDTSNISNCTSTGSINSGADSESIGGLIGLSSGYGDINNCSSTVTVTGGANAQYIGGLVGLNYCNISNSFHTGVVSGGDNSGAIGGLVGEFVEVEYPNPEIKNCYSTGAVSGTNNSSPLGGLVGYSDYAYINNCFSTCSVTGTANIGGLVGANESNNNISGCYSAGAVSGTDNNIGGLVGYNYGYIGNCYSTGAASGTSYIGGLVGYNYNTINNCYSSGKVTGNSNVGGLAGDNESSISSCYFLNVKGKANGYGTPLTDSQMKQQASFAGWNFVDIWRISEGNDYPKLDWQPISIPNVKFGTFNGNKNIKRTLKDFDGNNVTFALTGGGHGEIAPGDSNFGQIELFDTTEKSVLTISTKSKIWTSAGNIICYGPLKGISAKTTVLNGSITIGPSSNPKAAVTILFDRTSSLAINSDMPVKSITATELDGGSLTAPSVGSITAKGDKKRAILGHLNIDVIVPGAIGSVKAAGELSGNWDCNTVKSITTLDTDNFTLNLSRSPDIAGKILALGNLTAKRYFDGSKILSVGNIGTVTTGTMTDSICFAGIKAGISGLPAAETASFSEPATIRSFSIKGLKGETPPYFINNNIAAENVLSASIIYPQSKNNGVPFGMTAGYIKKLTIKQMDGTTILRKEPKVTEVFDNLEIRLY